MWRHFLTTERCIGEANITGPNKICGIREEARAIRINLVALEQGKMAT